MGHLAIMDAIPDWLQSKDYIEGVRLYLELGSDPRLKALFTQEAKTDYKAKRLERALRDLMDKPADKTPPVFVKEFVKPDDQWPDDADDVLKALKADGIRKFKEMQDMRSQLMGLPNDEARCEMAHAILRLDDEITLIWQKRDYYKAHGRLPSEPKEVELVGDPHLAMKRMTNLQRYIRREAQALKKDPGNAAAAARRLKFIKEYNHYAEKFGVESISESPEKGA